MKKRAHTTQFENYFLTPTNRTLTEKPSFKTLQRGIWRANVNKKDHKQTIIINKIFTSKAENTRTQRSVEYLIVDLHIIAFK